MAFSFDIDLGEHVDMHEKLAHVKQMAHDSPYHLDLVGDDQCGKIKGIIGGDYEVVDDCTLTITIKKKPLILSENKIKQALTGFFS
ncbi:MAG: hypothetical protein ACR2P1_13135 [Pseudomonadales bacterium]